MSGGTNGGWGKTYVDRLFAPVDVAILVYFRILFSGILLWEVWRYWSRGWARDYWVGKPYLYKYYGFEWVKAAPGPWPEYLWVMLAIPAALVFLGCFYRLGAAVFFLGFTYFFLLEQTNYLNHFYLICLLSFLAILIPANGAFSVDALWRRQVRRSTVPAWTLWALRLQVGLVYFYSGLGRLSGDWLGGEPMRRWLWERAEMLGAGSWVGRFLGSEAAPYLFSWGGVLMDLLALPALLWRRTRWCAIAALTVFHLLNSWMFSIGVFPWLSIGLLFLFCDPGWPRRFFRGFGWERRAAEGEVVEGGSSRRLVVWFLMIWFLWQGVMPLRHHLYPGNELWTDEGHRFAWQMRIRHKDGEAYFYKIDPVLETPVKVDLSEFIDGRQYSAMRYRPEMILQTAHWIADRVESEGYPRPTVNVVATAGLNGRPLSPLIDPRVDLATVERGLLPADWILPMQDDERSDF
ncbi:MAG: HTTM domain-containing protein [Verrucomicrobiota bacterium]